MSHGSRRLRTTAKAVGRPPDPKATCAADLSRQPHAGFDEAGAGDVTMGAGLRPEAKAADEPPDPTVRAPVLDPTGGGRRKRGLMATAPTAYPTRASAHFCVDGQDLTESGPKSEKGLNSSSS